MNEVRLILRLGSWRHEVLPKLLSGPHKNRCTVCPDEDSC
jgi:hypothetical protein